MATSTTAAAAPTTNTKTLSMKLLIDTKSQHLLFAEMGKDVVDFLFSLLALPIATAAKLMIGQEPVVGSVGNLYASVEKPPVAPLPAGCFRAGATPTGPAADDLLPVQLQIQQVLLVRSRRARHQVPVLWQPDDDAGVLHRPDEPRSEHQNRHRRRVRIRRREGVRAVRGDVHGDGRPGRHAHVHHLQHHAAQHIRGQGPLRAPGEDRADRLQGVYRVWRSLRLRCTPRPSSLTSSLATSSRFAPVHKLACVILRC